MEKEQMRTDSWRRIFWILIGLIMAWSFSKYTLPAFKKCHSECKAAKVKGWVYFVMFEDCYGREVE